MIFLRPVALVLVLACPATGLAQSVTAYEYDKYGRVVGVSHPGSTSVYSYDATDNRTSFSSTPQASSAPQGGVMSSESLSATDEVDSQPTACPATRIVSDAPGAMVRAICVEASGPESGGATGLAGPSD